MTEVKEEALQLPLGGVKMAAMANWLPGIYCSMLLADLGADVILIEHPSGRERAERPPGMAEILNRNKRSLTLNLRTPEGKEIFNRLAKNIDVFMEGFRPGATKRMGIDYESLNKINPRIIYCSLSGYGQDGPYREWPAHNGTYMGLGGMIQTMPDEPPQHNRNIATADLVAAMFGALSIAAAVRYAEKTGEGQYLDVAFLDCTVSWMAGNIGFLYGSGHLRPLLPASTFYKTKDDRYVTLSVGPTDGLWKNLCNAIGLEELAKLPRKQREERYEELEQSIREIIATRTSDEWVKYLIEADAPCGPVLTLGELSEDPQLKYRKMIIELTDDKGQKVKQIASPVKFSKTPLEIRKFAPELGEDTEQILHNLGYSQDEIGGFRKRR